MVMEIRFLVSVRVSNHNDKVLFDGGLFSPSCNRTLLYELHLVTSSDVLWLVVWVLWLFCEFSACYQSNFEPKTPPFASIWLLTWGGFSGVRPQILKIFACGGSKIPFKMPIESTKIPKFSRLRQAYCAAGDFCGFRVLLRAPQAKNL